MKIKCHGKEINVTEEYRFICPYCGKTGKYGTDNVLVSKTISSIINHINKCEYLPSNKKCKTCNSYRSASGWGNNYTGERCRFGKRSKPLPQSMTCDNWSEKVNYKEQLYGKNN